MAGDIMNYTVLSGLSMPSGGTVAINGGELSLGTYSFSITTAAAATSIPSGHLGVVFRASGISLVYVSGGTVYSFGSSSYSGAA
jgi:hypothetical protein